MGHKVNLCQNLGSASVCVDSFVTRFGCVGHARWPHTPVFLCSWPEYRTHTICLQLMITVTHLQAPGKASQTKMPHEFDLDFVILVDVALKPILLHSVLFTSGTT